MAVTSAVWRVVVWAAHWAGYSAVQMAGDWAEHWAGLKAGHWVVSMAVHSVERLAEY